MAFQVLFPPELSLTIRKQKLCSIELISPHDDQVLISHVRRARSRTLKPNPKSDITHWGWGVLMANGRPGGCKIIFLELQHFLSQ